MIKPIRWIRPCGTELETNGRQKTIDRYIKLGWKRAKGPTEDQIKEEMELQKLLDEEEKIKKEMEAAASPSTTLELDKSEKELADFLKK